MKKLKRRADTFNPLDFIAPNEHALDECRDLAEALVIREMGANENPHWPESAETVIGSVAATVAIYGRKDQGTRSLQDARDILAHPQKFDIAKKLMLENGGMLARWGGQLEHYKGEELGSVMSTSNRFLRFLDTPAIAESTKSSSFNPAGLRKGRMTVYLVLPPEHARAQSALLRMWIGSMFRACLRGGLGEKHKVHFVLDEAAALGHMQALDDAIDKYRGYGVRLQFYYQSPGQLRKCFPSDGGQTLLANCTKIFFGTSEFQTAEILSKSLGTGTIIVESGGSNSSWSKNHGSSSGHGYSESSGSSYSQGNNSNWQQQGRELLKPDEIIALDPRIAITLTPGVRPLWTTLIRWYEEKSLLRHRGFLRRMAAACCTFILSALLLVIAMASAKALTDQFNGVSQWPQQPLMAPAVHQQQPWIFPR
jgi:type IV secretion system protein VirD4